MHRFGAESVPPLTNRLTIFISNAIECAEAPGTGGCRAGNVRPMTYRVVVWGTGNVGRPAIRAVAAHRDLELVGAVVANPAKVGRDAGELAGIDPLGVLATDDTSVALADDVDAVVYAATGDTRPDEALGDLTGLPASRASTSSRPRSTRCCTRRARRGSCSTSVDPACAAGDASVFVSGIDPGWALDILPALVSGVGAGITEIRVQELFNYALYDQPDVVREVIGFGESMDELPLMLLDFSLDMVWAPMVRVLADFLERRGRRDRDRGRAPAARAHDRRARAWARSRPGTQGAFRFEVRGIVDGHPLLVVEHVTRIDDECAPDWPRSARPGGEHKVRAQRPPAPRGERCTAPNRANPAPPAAATPRGQPHRQRHPRRVRRAGRARRARSTSRDHRRRAARPRLSTVRGRMGRIRFPPPEHRDGSTGGQAMPKGIHPSSRRSLRHVAALAACLVLAAGCKGPWGWGQNDFGQVGDGTTSTRTAPGGNRSRLHGGRGGQQAHRRRAHERHVVGLGRERIPPARRRHHHRPPRSPAGGHGHQLEDRQRRLQPHRRAPHRRLAVGVGHQRGGPAG